MVILQGDYLTLNHVGEGLEHLLTSIMKLVAVATCQTLSQIWVADALRMKDVN